MRVSEEAAKLAHEDNAKLLEVQCVLREENSGLRDLMKKATTGAMQASAVTAAAAPVAATTDVKSPDVGKLAMKLPGLKCKENHTGVVGLNEEKISPKLGAR